MESDMKDEPQPREHDADGLDLFVFGEHIHKHADAGEHCDERDKVESLQRGDLGGDGGADICAHDDGGRLIQSHDARIDKAYDHDGRGGRTLNDGGGDGADADAREFAFGSFIEPAAHAAVRQFFDAFG